MTKQELSNIGNETRIMISEYLKQGNTVNKLATKSGLHSSQIWLFMRGERGLTDTSMEKLGKAMLK